MRLSTEGSLYHLPLSAGRPQPEVARARRAADEQIRERDRRRLQARGSLLGDQNAETAKQRNSRLSFIVGKPELTNAARPATFEVEAYNERGEMVPTAIAGEHPLTLYSTARDRHADTLGHAPEALVIGYLRTSASSIRSTTSPPCKSMGNRLGRRHDLAQKTDRSRQEDRHLRLRARNDVRQPDGEIEQIDSEKTFFWRMRISSSCSTGCASTRPSTSRRRRARLRAMHHGGRDSCSSRTSAGITRVDAIAGFMWLQDIDGSDKVLYDRPAHLRDGDQVRADAHPVPRLRSGLTQMVTRSQPGRHHDARTRERQHYSLSRKERVVRSSPQPTPWHEPRAVLRARRLLARADAGSRRSRRERPGFRAELVKLHKASRNAEYLAMNPNGQGAGC